LVPQSKAIGLLVDPAASNADAMIREAQNAARLKGVEFHVLKAGSTDYDEIDAAFAALPGLRTGGLIIGTDSNILRLAYLVALPSRYAVPAIFPWSEFVWAGGLISYGPNPETAFRQMGVYAARILKGEEPADLPVMQPTKFELVINMKTAKALGLAVPPALLARADEVIE
jgi:putative ABC transport system substrate-binding protein